MDNRETLDFVKKKLFTAVETRKNPKYLEIYLNDASAFISYENEVRLLCIEFLIRIGDVERAEKHILDTDAAECGKEIDILRSMLLSRQGRRREGRELLDSVSSGDFTGNSLRLYVSAFEEYGEFEKAFEILKSNIDGFEGDEFLLRMLTRLYNEMIMKAELFNEREKAAKLRGELEIYTDLLEKLGADNDQQ